LPHPPGAHLPAENRAPHGHEYFLAARQPQAGYFLMYRLNDPFDGGHILGGHFPIVNREGKLFAFNPAAVQFSIDLR
jgi:hypothetical protein